MEYIAQDFLSNKTVRVVVAAESIQSVSPVPNQETDLWLTPGFCDLQVNGGFGLDLNAKVVTVEQVIQLNQRLLQHGVTAWCPTVITAESRQMLHCLAVIDEACRTDPLVASCVAGIHLEGPFLSPVEGARGAHALDFLRQPDPAAFAEFQQAAGGRIAILTIAPELNGALDLIETLSSQGILVGLGHTMANRGQIAEAIQAGAGFATHLGNGLPAQVHRHDNPFIHLLAQDDLFASVIFDGHHLPPAIRKLILRTKTLDRLMMVSDATRLTGLPAGSYEEPIGGMVELSADGRLSLAGTPYLAGAAMTLLEDVNAMGSTNTFSLTELLQLSMKNPRDFLGFRQESQVLIQFDAQPKQMKVIFAAINDSMIFHKE